MMKKVFALLMALMMVLSMGAAYAAETRDAGQIGNYYDVDDENGSLPSTPELSGASWQSYANGDVKVRKSLEATGTENVFNVTLEVATTEKINEKLESPDVATVIVIDASNSMTNNNSTRLADAKTAAQTFINNYALPKDADATRKVAIVKFSGYPERNVAGAVTVQDWTDAYNLLPTNGNALHSAISGIQTDGGTCTEAGLILAKNLLKEKVYNAKGEEITMKNIILLTDGKPTYGVKTAEESNSSTSAICENGNYIEGDGQDTEHASNTDTHKGAEREAAAIKALGVDCYAIYVGNQNVNCQTSGCDLDTSGRNWLANYCKFTTYSTENSSQLTAIFEQILNLIELKAQAWEADDPMGTMVDFNQFNREANPANEFVLNGENIEWDIKGALPSSTVTNEDGVTTYYYTLSYQITLDTLNPNFEADKAYATNGVTGVTYLVTETDANGNPTVKESGTAYFNVPSVKGYASVPLYKEDNAGKKLANAEFTLSHSAKCGCTASDATKEAWTNLKGSSDAKGLITFNDGDITALPSGHTYILTETKAPVGYVLNGESIELVVSQGKINGKTSYTMTNAPILTTVTATKVWNDANDQDGVRPDSITLILKANGNVLIRQQVTEQDGWKYTFSGLNKYADGKEIAYTVEEEEVTDYTTAISGSAADGFTVTNTHTPATIEVAGAKTWNDNDNQDGIRPESITINLLADGKQVKTAAVTAENGWKYEFTNLPKYEAGELIEYTITENAVDGYTAKVDGFNVTNTHTLETISVSGAKTWVDNNNQDGKRPASIIINLLADGEKVDSKAVSADDEGDWSWSFTNLPKYKKAGTAIVYTITEEPVTDYTAEVDGYNVTNTHEIEKVDVSGSKTWNDANNQDGKRPESITINLFANGEKVDSKTVTSSDNWAWSFDGLAKYAQGVAITYTITEETVADYTTEVDGYNVTNSYTPGKVSVSGSKTWDDADNQDGLRPESITINLLADGEKFDSKTITAEDSWSWNFINLDEYKAGKLIEYTITEDAVEGYTTEVKDFNVINTHTPATIEVAGTKTWDDADNQDGKRPESITINLLANGEQVKTTTATADTEWKYVFTELPKFEAGKEIVYTIAEDAVEGYSTTYDGYNVTNSYTPGKTNVAGAKTWIDNDDQDGKRPESITINLLADGVKVDSKTVTAADEWKWNFENLDEYKAGQKIVYTITEEAVEGYEAKVEGYNVTNTHEIEKITVTGSKTWVGDTADMRPASITINLLADGVEKDEAIVTADDEWTWNFEDLDKYQAGKEIVYTITEDAIDYYTATVEGYNVINTRNEVAAKSFNVTKKIEKVGAVAPVPGTYTFDFTVMANKAEETSAMFMARQVVPNNNVTIQIDGGEQKTVALGQPVIFSIDVEVTENGAEWKNTSKVNFWLNDEDSDGVEFEVVETSIAPAYWTYDNTAKTVALNNLAAGAEIINKYNEGYITTKIPVAKTVVQAGNIAPGVNTFYYELLFVTEDRDSLNVSVIAAEDSIGKVVDLHNDQFSLTVDGAGMTSAYVAVQYPESADLKGILLLEKTSADGSVTMAELEAAGWIYDKSATREPMEDGSTLIYPWFIDLNEDGSVTVRNAEDKLVDEVNIINTYTASTPPPKTGDNSNIALWLALMSVSALCFVVISKRRSA